MKLAYAQIMAQTALEKLAPFCDRIEIAGSIRRLKEEPKDIELICIPKKYKTGLFGETSQVHPEFVAAVQSWKRIKGDPTGKYTQREIKPGIVLDLFMATPENWGMIYLIRTGPAEYVKQEILGRFSRWGYKSEGGFPIHKQTKEKLRFREENEVFDFLQLPYSHPQHRKYKS